ncbi:MAG: class I SAM-dependent methyltransferase [Candidatus Helarchaeota archaeon]
MEILSPCVYISKKEGEKLRKFLLELQILDRNKNIKLEGNKIFFPLIKELDKNLVSHILENFTTVKFTESNFRLREIRNSKKFFDILPKYLDKQELNYVPKSFDIIGKIAIIEIPDEIQKKGKLLAELLLEHNKALESVFAKSGKVNGEFRLRQLRYLAGKEETVTIHKENGCRYELDVKKVYFSPRLSTEHLRIANLVNSDEIVLDMFAGIGTFSILIAKRVGAIVYSFDKNPDAIFYLKRNMKLNKVENLVKPFLGDANELIGKSVKEKFDRIIMNLPETTHRFLLLAINSIKLKGGIIHFYMFKKESESFDKIEENIQRQLKETNRHITILKTRRVKSTAPHEWQICIDMKVE